MVTQLRAAWFQQQPVTVTGIVASITGDAIPAATVNQKGTNVATVTDVQGKFSITVSSANAVLVVSSVGFARLEVPLSGRTNLDTIKLSPAAAQTNLDEVVVIGYGTARRQDLTTAAVSVNSKDFYRALLTIPCNL
ncbi:carboxypeptidase-like regulatory domain-containing protein [Niabella hibiscisoli]|uniref:carboxypeptidase-like regulatory domain-containing protein n=1 Tax=Niabella hibiscisoli TaxID=1825928 RepID=UPI001F0E7FCD|nr:carboxypeptidase-like regulatory domain-containing protein [Niabella hibiscisoli]MCH5720575.1 carboxypeptidase-like regulatory domain-containing protein [Niabella hibiscisoli]